MIRKLSIILLISLICTNLTVAAHADRTVNFGGSDETQEEQEVVPDETETETGTDLPETEEGETVPDESTDTAAPEETPVEGDQVPESGDSTVTEKTDPFIDYVPEVLDPPAVDDTSTVLVDDTLLYSVIPSGSPVSGYYVTVSSSLGSGDLFVPKEYAQGTLTYDEGGCMISLANETVNGLLVADGSVYEIRFYPFSRPQYYSYSSESNYGSWVDCTIYSHEAGGNVQVMTSGSDVMSWISDDLFEACVLALGGVLVCKVFMSR